MSADRLEDSHARVMRTLRISVNDDCDMACSYCNMLPAGTCADAGDRLMTPAEIAALAGVFAGLGVARFRLTGGEPLLRPDIVGIVSALAGVVDVADLALTTNGLRLAGRAGELREAGLRRVNVSLDTLDREAFRRATGHDGLDSVVAGIRAAVRAGFSPVRLNAVVVRGTNAQELPALAAFARDEGAVMRFIELMPVGVAGRGWAAGYVPALEMASLLAPVLATTDIPPDGPGPARYLPMRGGGEVGIIAPVSRPFCGGCGRLRLSAEGRLRTCLTAESGADLLGPLRAGAGAAGLARLIRAETVRKQARAEWSMAVRNMVVVGG